MIKKNNKGFTLVELLAVIVVLIIISVLAINKISEVMRKNNENAVLANASTLIKNVDQNASMSRLNGKFDDGIYSVSKLYNEGLNIRGTKPKSGILSINDGKVLSACLVYDKYIAKYNNGKTTIEKSQECGGFLSFEYVFNYSGDTEAFNVPYNGTYKLEVWGAQGGSSGSATNGFGGYGGYSTGTITLTKGDVLYVVVGGRGVDGDNTSTTKNGGYNGGGDKITPTASYYSSSGGGATHIAKSNGVLSSLSSSLSDIIIVAGGGGGGAGLDGNYGAGGSGGGIAGSSGGNNSGDSGWASGGTQVAPGCKAAGTTLCGSFGQGNGTSTDYGGAGGGGYYGGGATGSNHIGGGGGGSGYINTSLLTNALMYCYNCTESDEPSTMTISTTCHQSNPTENCSKMNNGYAKITYIE